MDILGIGSAVSGIANSVMSGINTHKTIKANKKMAEYAYSKDLEMWNRQNEYNNPAQQMARLKGAGLNPNMAYGSGSVAGNTSGQIPKYQAPEQKYDYQLPDVGQMLSQYTNTKQNVVQTDLIKQQANNAKQDGINKGIQSIILSENAKGAASKSGILALEKLQKEALSPYFADIAGLKVGQEKQKLSNLATQENLWKTGIKKGESEIRGQELKNIEQIYKNKLYDANIQPSDNLIFRQLALFGAGMGWSVEKVVEWWKENMVPTQWKD